MTWRTVAKDGDVAPGSVQVVDAGGRRLALCNVEGQLHAIDDVCTHDGASLDQGELLGNRIECPRHGAQFDVTTGRALTLPAIRPVCTYPVRTTGGQVEVDVP